MSDFSRHNGRARKRLAAWERDLLLCSPDWIHQGSKGDSVFSNRFKPAVEVWAWQAKQSFSDLHSTATSVRIALRNWGGLHRVGLRRAGIGLVAAASAAVFAGIGVAITAYVNHDPLVLERSVATRRFSGVYDLPGNLVAAVGDGTLDVESSRKFAYIPLESAPPEIFKRAVLVREDRSFDEQGPFHLCGTNLLNLPIRWFTSGVRAGGSGLMLQATKQVLEPEWGKAEGLLESAYYKAVQLGVSCRLWEQLVSEGGPDKVFEFYASIAPLIQGGGSVRGLQAGSYVMQGVAPGELSKTWQLLFAAALKQPIVLGQDPRADIACENVFPASHNPAFDGRLATDNAVRANHCAVIARAIHAAKLVLEGPEQREVITALEALRKTGLIAANPFSTSTPGKRIVNLTARTQAVMGAPLTTRLVADLKSLDGFGYGDRIDISMDMAKNADFAKAVRAGLSQAEKSGNGQRKLCLNLLPSSPRPFNPECGVPTGVTAEHAPAETLAVSLKIRNGQTAQFFATTPSLADLQLGLGSISKLVALGAAMESNIGPDSQWCARQVRDGVRLLKRVGNRPFGFTAAECAAGHGLVSLEQAVAASDNLAFAELAKTIGEDKLRKWVDRLGFKANSGEPLWYAVSFGTLVASPLQVAAAYRALVAVATGIQAKGKAPSLITTDMPSDDLMTVAVGAAIPSATARANLLQLLEAPVKDQKVGTLRYLTGNLAGGKSGSSQSPSLDVNGHHNAAHKWIVGHRDSFIHLFVVASPAPRSPLALHDIQASTFFPAQRPLFMTSQSTSPVPKATVTPNPRSKIETKDAIL